MRQIKRDLNMAMGTIQYHLTSLEEMGKIISERADYHRFYFPIGTFGDSERNILKILNRDSARDILLFIIEQKNPTQTDIASNIKISSGTANWHISRLLEYGIISEQKEGKFKKYVINGNSRIIITLLQNYHKTKWNSWSNKLAELFMDMEPQGDKQ
jgi:predicted transcriptional regulator